MRRSVILAALASAAIAAACVTIGVRWHNASVRTGNAARLLAAVQELPLSPGLTDPAAVSRYLGVPLVLSRRISSESGCSPGQDEEKELWQPEFGQRWWFSVRGSEPVKPEFTLLETTTTNPCPELRTVPVAEMAMSNMGGWQCLAEDDFGTAISSYRVASDAGEAKTLERVILRGGSAKVRINLSFRRRGGDRCLTRAAVAVFR